MRQLRWYLENFLDYPFHPDTQKAEHVLNALKAWGTAAFNALFDRRDAEAWLLNAGILPATVTCCEDQEAFRSLW